MEINAQNKAGPIKYLIGFLIGAVFSVYLLMPIIKAYDLCRISNVSHGLPNLSLAFGLYQNPIETFLMLRNPVQLKEWVILLMFVTIGIIFVAFSIKSTTHTQTGINYKTDDGTCGSATWMTIKQIRGQLTNVLEIGAIKGIIYGTLKTGMYKNETVTLSLAKQNYLNKNIAVFGASGSGKSRVFIRNSIFQDVINGRSMIITDPKGELYQDMAPFLRTKGYIVKLFNIIKDGMKYSDRWNPVSEVTDDLTAQTFCEVVIANTRTLGSKGDPFWENGEQNLLKALILYVINDYPEEERNLETVYSLIACGDLAILDNKFARLGIKHPAKMSYNIYKQAPENVRTGIVTGLGTRLQVFQNALVQGLTSTNDIDLSLPGKQKCAYFCMSSDMESTFDFLGGLFYSFLFIKLINYADLNGGHCDVDVDFKLDEFCNIGQIPDFGKKISTMRSRGISSEIIFQNIAQLENRYPNKSWTEILGNCDSSLCLGTTDIVTAEYVSKIMGDATVETVAQTKKNGFEGIFDLGSSKIGAAKRELIAPSEILKMKYQNAILLLRGQSPLLLNKLDFSKHPMAKELHPQKITETPIKDWALKLDKSTYSPTKKENSDVLENKNPSDVKTPEKDISEMPPVIIQSNRYVEDRKAETTNIAKKKWW